MSKKKKPGEKSDSSVGNVHPANPRSEDGNSSDESKKKAAKAKAAVESSSAARQAGRIAEQLADMHAKKQPDVSSAPGKAAEFGPEREVYAPEEAAGLNESGPGEQVLQTGMLEDEVRELKDQLLRKQAEFENFRKRLSREKAEGIRYSNQMLLLDLLTVIDDFERAIASAEESKDFHAFHDGVVLIERRLTSLLEKNWGLKRFESLGEEFNPDRHQAIALEESTEVDRPTVIEDYQKGYFYHERVLRPAKVKVAQPRKAEDRPENKGTEESQGE